MVSGEAPRIAPDVAAVPVYRASADESPFAVNTYVGTPILQADGSLFGSVRGFDPERGADALSEHGPLLDLLSSLSSSVLEADLRATETARQLETARRDSETDALTGLLNRRGRDRFVAREEAGCPGPSDTRRTRSSPASPGPGRRPTRRCTCRSGSGGPCVADALCNCPQGSRAAGVTGRARPATLLP
ncbi:hypothetical protein GCM10023175_17820 [Pseudonocardia xishanensis]|uniref:GAF domain-containing protein n=2 Tax=Pseudonocardia xishanensis TaxID=630995 RepID=A0ABP8RMD2_9PSEU